jgi:hypothetical protein
MKCPKCENEMVELEVVSEDASVELKAWLCEICFVTHKVKPPTELQ